jgi:hypothetical protein
MAKKLTQEAIRRISTTVSEDAAREKLAALTKKRGDIGYELFKSLVGLQVMAQLTSLPIEFVNYTGSIDLGLAHPEGGRTSQMDGKKFNDYVRIEFGTSRPSLASAYSHSEVLSVEPDNELYLQYLEACAELKAANELKDKARQKLRGLLVGAKTVEKAIAIWPEGKAHLEPLLEAPLNLPAVAAQEVNDVLSELGGLKQAA